MITIRGARLCKQVLHEIYGVTIHCKRQHCEIVQSSNGNITTYMYILLLKFELVFFEMKSAV